MSPTHHRKEIKRSDPRSRRIEESADRLSAEAISSGTIQSPNAIQNTTVLAAGILTASKTPESAKALINFLASPSTAASLQADGFQPAANN